MVLSQGLLTLIPSRCPTNLRDTPHPRINLSPVSQSSFYPWGASLPTNQVQPCQSPGLAVVLTGMKKSTGSSGGLGVPGWGQGLDFRRPLVATLRGGDKWQRDEVTWA